jgi:hypothetical protein
VEPFPLGGGIHSAASRSGVRTVAGGSGLLVRATHTCVLSGAIGSRRLREPFRPMAASRSARVAPETLLEIGEARPDLRDLGRLFVRCRRTAVGARWGIP